MLFKALRKVKLFAVFFVLFSFVCVAAVGMDNRADENTYIAEVSDTTSIFVFMPDELLTENATVQIANVQKLCWNCYERQFTGSKSCYG